MYFHGLWPFAFLLIVPLLWWVRSRTLTNFNRRQSMVQAAVRSALVICLVLALTQPIVYHAARWISVVYAVDVSDSVSADSISTAASWIDQANRAGRPDDWRIVAVGRNAAVLQTSDELRALASTALRPGSEQALRPGSGQALRLGSGQALRPGSGQALRPGSGQARGSSPDRSGTNLEAGLTFAWRRFAPNHLKRLVLVSDGRETEGDAVTAAARMARDGVRIYTLPAQPVARRDAWVERVKAHDAVTASEPFRVQVDVFSQTATSGTLEIRHQGAIVATRDMRLSDGSNHVELDARIDREGAAMLDVSWRSPADAVSANNELRLPVFVRQPTRILYVEGRPQSALYLQRALEEGGFAVDVRSPTAMPTSESGLEPYAAVILSDVARSALADRSIAALATYVADRGGGFVMTGGENVFGGPGLSRAGGPTESWRKGYASSDIERILPVTFSVKEDPEDVAVVIVLDKSWSMAGPFIELAKEAAKAAVDVLNDRHQIGVVTFNDSFDWPVQLQSAANRRDIKDRISSIVPSSHTNIFPALESAGLELQKAKAKTKHVILLSDGQTYPDEYEKLVTSMAGSKITVSTVAVGTEADRILLGNIARWGQGRAYALENAHDVPQIFMKEVQNTARQTLVEKPLKPVVRKQAGLFAGLNLAGAPALLGYTATQPKKTAETLLATPTGDPLLARWQYGLGRTVIFTSDVKDRWAVDWLRWSGYGKFWSQLVRDVMAGARPDATLTVTRRGGEARIAIDAIDRSGLPRNLLSPRVEVMRQGPSSTEPNRRSVIDLQQTGPGKYEATVPLSQSEDYVVRLLNEPAARDLALNASSSLVPAAYPEELRVRPPDEALLRAVSAEGAGGFKPAPADLFARQDEMATTPVRLWPFFACLALSLWLGDILLRRVRILEPA
ncbi:MAG: VWA domain-containing protein [Acidobacteria bacterium]|nr:VWA domain-containing protein [Acidobacteriota bacterium]